MRNLIRLLPLAGIIGVFDGGAVGRAGFPTGRLSWRLDSLGGAFKRFLAELRECEIDEHEEHEEYGHPANEVTPPC